MEKNSISVIIPCFNEGRRIYENIQKIKKYLENNFETFEIIAVNDGSLDNTGEELKRLQSDLFIEVIVHKKNRGKGQAVKDGFLASQNEVVMFLDADLAIPIEELGKFFEEIKGGYQIVIASRFVPGLKIVRPVLWYRRILEKVYRILRIIIIDARNVKDTQCGFKVFTRRAMLDIFPYLTVERFAFDSEVIFLAKKRRYEIKELPITLQNPTVSSIRIYSDSVNMFLDLLRIRKNDILGKYNLKI